MGVISTPIEWVIDTSFYGAGLTVDTSKVFTVVTQFIGDPLTEIKRFYVQGVK